MKTQIYSCGRGTTSLELVDSITTRRDVWFPELVYIPDKCWAAIPLHESEQLSLLPDLIGRSIVTVSETIILMFLREVRKARMFAGDLELYCNGRRIEVGISGDMIDPWDGGFFETGFHLRFSDVPT